MEAQERRKHLRCQEDTAIIYSFINKTENHSAVARNYSRFGMYIESDAPLSPGTIIVVRTLGCKEASDFYAGESEKRPARFYCRDARLDPGPCRELKSLVTAEVKRCERIQNIGELRYGIGVHFVGPAL